MALQYRFPARSGGGGQAVHPATAHPVCILNKDEMLAFVRQRGLLFDRAGEANPFACSAWVLHFIQAVAGDDWEFTVADRCDDGESLMLLYQRRGSPRHISALANCYASLYSPLVSSAGDRIAAIRRLVSDLAQARPAPALVELGPLAAESHDTAALARAFREQGWYVQRHFCFGNWYQPCGGLSFEAYMAGRDSRLLNTWARKARKFSPGAAGNARLEIVTDGAGVDAAMDAYERIYARSWKPPEAYPGFVRGWARVCAANGWLRLGLAWVGEVPVAAQFWFVMHGRASIFKLAYDENYAKWSAGTVLTAHMFRHALEVDRVTEIDYLTGDDAYKQSWMNSRRERIGLLACNPRTVQGLTEVAKDLARRFYRHWHPGAGAGSGQGLGASP